jgi:hypothetical protein
MLDFIRNTRHYKKVFSDWQTRYDVQAPKSGDLAPDFALSDTSGEHDVRLSDFRGERPVALVFGSFT